MKALPWICACSLAANLALLAYTGHRFTAQARHALAPTEPGPGAPSSAPAFPPHDAPAGDRAFLRADTPLARILEGTDLRAMRDALAAAGLADADAKAVIRSRIRESQKAAREAIERRRGPEQDAWWYVDDEARQKFEDQRDADRRALSEQAALTLADLFGPEETPAAEPRIHDRARFLPETKRLAVSRVVEDYEKMERELRSRDPMEHQLPSDLEKRRFLREEFQRDLASLLSPEELREFNLRHSSTAQDLRRRIGAMKPTRAEYEVIHDAMEALSQRYDVETRVDRPPEFWQERHKAEAETFAALRRQLGEHRFIDYALSADLAAAPLRQVVERYQLSPDLPRLLWKLRQEAGRQGTILQNDDSLPVEEKRARLADMRQRMQGEIDALLPPEAAAELKDNNLLDWLEPLRRNQFSVFHELGNSSTGSAL